jgi:excisionase family DNA binding protein
MSVVESFPRFRTPHAAAYLGVSKSFLEKLRVEGGGPGYFKLGKTVVYERQELDDWLQSRKRYSTSQYAVAA